MEKDSQEKIFKYKCHDSILDSVGVNQESVKLDHVVRVVQWLNQDKM